MDGDDAQRSATPAADPDGQCDHEEAERRQLAEPGQVLERGDVPLHQGGSADQMIGVPGSRPACVDLDPRSDEPGPISLASGMRSVVSRSP